MKNNKTINAIQPVIFGIPSNTVKLKIYADIIDENNKIRKAKTTILLPDIIEARISAEYWEDENVTYTLTDKAKKELGIE